MQNPLFGAVVQKVPKDPQIILAIAIELHFPQELDVENLLLKILHINSQNKQGEVRLVLTIKLHLCWLSYIVLEGVIHAINRERQAFTLPSESCELQ